MMEDGSQIINLPNDEYERIFGKVSPRIKSYFDREPYIFDLEKLVESLLVTSDYYRDYLERYNEIRKKHGLSPVENVDI